MAAIGVGALTGAVPVAFALEGQQSLKISAQRITAEAFGTFPSFVQNKDGSRQPVLLVDLRRMRASGLCLSTSVPTPLGTYVLRATTPLDRDVSAGDGQFALESVDGLDVLGQQLRLNRDRTAPKWHPHRYLHRRSSRQRRPRPQPHRHPTLGHRQPDPARRGNRAPGQGSAGMLVNFLASVVPAPQRGADQRRWSHRSPGLPRRSWRNWRRSRPLDGAVLTVAAGSSLMGLPAGSYTLVLLPGLAGTTGFLFGAGLCVLGLFLLLQPRSHAFAGAATVLVALASVATTNLGGFGVGVLLGILGSALGFAWTPEAPTTSRARTHRHPSTDPTPT